MDLEASLKAALERHLQAADGRTPPNLGEAIRYSLLAPGKRIRPRLTLACASLTDLPLEAALPAALSIEMIHCFTLIHDDLPCMDDDDFRRGRPSNHKVHGEALALLAGDALVPLALDVLADAAPFVEPGHFLKALRRFAWATGPRGVIGGQAAEALLTDRSPLEDLRTMHAMKTGALFSAALLLPKDLAGVPERAPAGQPPKGETLERFAAELGLAFQVADDLDDAQSATGAGATGPEADKPTSILHYLPANEARRDTLVRLSAATRALTEAWGADAARPLAQIAAEVSASLGGKTA